MPVTRKATGKPAKVREDVSHQGQEPSKIPAAQPAAMLTRSAVKRTKADGDVGPQPSKMPAASNGRSASKRAKVGSEDEAWQEDGGAQSNSEADQNVHSDLDDDMRTDLDDEPEDDDEGSSEEEQEEEEEEEEEEDPLEPTGRFVDQRALFSRTTYKAQKRYFEHFVCKVQGKGFAVPRTQGGCDLVSDKKLGAEFQDIFFLAGGKTKKSFIKRWLKDHDKRWVSDINYVPRAPGDPPGDSDVYNLFFGYGPFTEPLPSASDVKAMVRGWREIGVELCEGDREKFDFFEQWLAHLIQFPSERCNTSFAFVGGGQGMFKNTFFTPVAKILGAANCIETGNIHEVVNSSKGQSRLACKLLVVLEESKNQSTKHFREQLKTTVTGSQVALLPNSTSNKLKSTVDAHHRFVLLSNHLDGLGLNPDEKYHRRFNQFQPTENLTKMKRYEEFHSAYITRFVNPGDERYLRALFAHLSSIKVRYRTTAEWEANTKHLQSTSLRSTTSAPVSAPVDKVYKWLFNLTQPYCQFEVQADQRPFTVDADAGVRMCEPYNGGEQYDERYPGTYDLWGFDSWGFKVQITKQALYASFAADPGTGPTKFSQTVGPVFYAARRGALSDEDRRRGTLPQAAERKAHGGHREWLFDTLEVHRWLLKEYPALATNEESEAAGHAHRAEKKLKILNKNVHGWLEALRGFDEPTTSNK